MCKYLLFLSLFFLFNACESGPYKNIVIHTPFGDEVIPYHCSAWTDGCSVFCRTNKAKEYIERPLNQKCKDSDIIGVTCIDDDPDKLKLCEKID